MDNFIWHSKGNTESAELLYDHMGNAEIGLLPPKGFEGVALCFGAKPAAKFKWENREFKAIFNDPRQVSGLIQSKTSLLDSVVANEGTIIRKTAVISESTLSLVAQSLGLEAADSVYVCGPTLKSPTLVSTQAELAAAVGSAEGMVALRPDEVQTLGSTVLVVNKKAYIYTRPQLDSDAAVKEICTQNGVLNNAYYSFLKKAVVDEKKLSITSKGVGQVEVGEADFDDAEKTLINSVIAAVGDSAQMYRIKLVKTEGTTRVANVTFSPSLMKYTDESLNVVCEAITDWVAESTKTCKQSLLNMLEEADEEAAQAMMEAIQNYVSS